MGTSMDIPIIMTKEVQSLATDIVVGVVLNSKVHFVGSVADPTAPGVTFEVTPKLGDTYLSTVNGLYVHDGGTWIIPVAGAGSIIETPIALTEVKTSDHFVSESLADPIPPIYKWGGLNPPDLTYGGTIVVETDYTIDADPLPKQIYRKAALIQQDATGAATYASWHYNAGNNWFEMQNIADLIASGQTLSNKAPSSRMYGWVKETP